MAVSEGMMRLLGRYSEGFRLAAEHGPGSGWVVEHAYRNRPVGHGAIGRLIDRRFLHQSTWDGVRRRFDQTKLLVRAEIDRRRTMGRRTVIVDIAAGTGCYLRDLAKEVGGTDVEIICRERDARLVMHARELAALEESAVTICVGDPADEASYLNANDPDILIASGLLPMIERDDVVRHVFRLVWKYLAPGGMLVVTTLESSRGHILPWNENGRVPTPRTADTVAAWLRSTGFRDVEVGTYDRDAAWLTARRPFDL